MIKKHNTTDVEKLESVKKVLLAKFNAKRKDSLNDFSTFLLMEAVQQVEKLNDAPLQIWVHTQAGFYLYSYNQYVDALPYFLKSSRELDILADAELLDASYVLKLNAYFFQTISEYDKAIDYLKRALTLTSKQSSEYGDILNALGNNYFNKGDLKKAKNYFTQTLRSAQQNNDQLRYAKALGDLAQIEISRENWVEAEKLLLEDINISKLVEDERNTMFAQLQLGKMYWKKNDWKLAKQTMNHVQKYASSKQYLKSFEFEAVEILLRLAVRANNEHQELTFRRKLEQLQKDIETNESSEVINQVALRLQKEKVQWQLEAEQKNLEKVHLQKWAWTAISALLFLLAILMFAIYKNRLKLKTTEFKQKLLLFHYEKIQSEKKLRETDNTLKAYKTYLKEKNIQINQLKEEIIRIKEVENTPKNMCTKTLEHLLSSHLMTDENWLLFKQAFIAEQATFYNKILQQLPKLTESNLRIILLSKMGLNNKETAQILGVTIDAVKKAKQRLRKKYENTADFFI